MGITQDKNIQDNYIKYIPEQEQENKDKKEKNKKDKKAKNNEAKNIRLTIYFERDTKINKMEYEIDNINDTNDIMAHQIMTIVVAPRTYVNLCFISEIEIKGKKRKRYFQIIRSNATNQDYICDDVDLRENSVKNKKFCGSIIRAL